jgi:hypothetical protein
MLSVWDQLYNSSTFKFTVLCKDKFHINEELLHRPNAWLVKCITLVCGGVDVTKDGMIKQFIGLILSDQMCVSLCAVQPAVCCTIILLNC